MVSSLQISLKKYLLAGALVLVPIVVTLAVLKTIIFWCEDFFASFIPVSWQPIHLLGFAIPGLGLLFTLLIVLLTGILTRLYFGRKLIALGDKILSKIPLGRSIYKGVQQFMNAVATPSQNDFRQVVLVEYPRKDSYMIGFVTGESSEIFQQKLGQKMIHVFIPTSPNPTSGFLIVIPRENVTPVNISNEAAFKLIISGGAVQS